MTPRLKSAVYVQALMRRAESSGAQAYLLRRGAEEAGAVFLKVNRLDGTFLVWRARAKAPKGGWFGPRRWATAPTKPRSQNILRVRSNSIPISGLSKSKTVRAAPSWMSRLFRLALRFAEGGGA